MQLYFFRDFKSCPRLITQLITQLTDRLVLDLSLIGLAFGDYFEVVYDEMNQC